MLRKTDKTDIMRKNTFRCDPAKWGVPGSGGGQNWETPDKQEGQIFVNRFQPRGFGIKAPKSYKWREPGILEHGNGKDMQFSRSSVFGE